MTRAVLLILDGPVARQTQLVQLHAYAVEHALTVTAVVVGSPAAAVAACQAGAAEAILAWRPDADSVLALCGFPVLLLHPPRPVQRRPAVERMVCGVRGRLVDGALERLGGDIATVALVFDLPLDVVAAVDVERRARPAVAA